MPLKYTSPELIARRLRGRLELATPLYGGTIGAGQVDLDLIEQVGTQVESRIDLALNLIYVLPVQPGSTLALSIIGGIVEKFVISEIASVHFQSAQSAELGGDAGFGSVLRKQAQEELGAIVAGHGISIPGLVASTNNVQPIVLPGLQLRSSDSIPDTISRNSVVVAQRTSGKAEQIDWGV